MDGCIRIKNKVKKKRCAATENLKKGKRNISHIALKMM
jgi:hypothetical protein